MDDLYDERMPRHSTKFASAVTFAGLLTGGCLGPGAVYSGSNYVRSVDVGEVWIADAGDTLDMTVQQGEVVSLIGEPRLWNAASTNAHVSGLMGHHPVIEATGPHTSYQLHNKPRLIGYESAGAAIPGSGGKHDHDSGDQYIGPEDGSGSGPVGNLYRDGRGHIYRLERVESDDSVLLSPWCPGSSFPGETVSARVRGAEKRDIVKSRDRSTSVTRREDGSVAIVRRGEIIEDTWLRDVVNDWEGKTDYRGWIGRLSAECDALVVVRDRRDLLVYKCPNAVPELVATNAEVNHANVSDVALDQGQLVLLTEGKGGTGPAIRKADGTVLASLDAASLPASSHGARRDWNGGRFEDHGKRVLLSLTEVDTSAGKARRVVVIRWDWITGKVSCGSIDIDEVLRTARRLPPTK